MKFLILILGVTIFIIISPNKSVAQFPQSDPYRWQPLPNGQNRQLGSFGGGSGQSGSFNIAAQQRLNNRWEVGGKVGVDYFPGGTNKRVDAGVGYNIKPNLQIRGSVGSDLNGANKRGGVGLNYQFG